MMYHGSGMGFGWSIIFFALVLPALFLVAGLLFGHFHRFAGTHEPPAADAERVLADRFARGEIDQEDYELRLRALRTPRR
jgi:putative membrane protein